MPDQPIAMLFPAEAAYRQVMQRRRQRFAMAPLRIEGCVVVSVGNLTTGGTGKTPCVQWVARLFQERGARVAIVARGYGGTLSRRGAIVSDGTTIFHDAHEVGDEPLSHALALPDVAVVIGRDRIEAARRAVSECGAQVVVLDDGFQFWSLARDCDLVLLDARRPFGNGRLLPHGRLREEAQSLQRASAIGLTRANQASREEIEAAHAQVRKYSDAPIFEASHAPLELRRATNTANVPMRLQSANSEAANGEANAEYVSNPEVMRDADVAPNADVAASGEPANGAESPAHSAVAINVSVAGIEAKGERKSLESVKGARVVALSALADNASFARTLHELGACIVSHVARRDHHAWRETEVLAAARLAQTSGALLVTTEKDAVKMRASLLPVALWSLAIALQITRGESELRLLLDRIEVRNDL